MSHNLSVPSFDTILYEKRNATAYVTLNRPEVMNALNQKAIAELRAAFEDAQDDPQIRGVIITGAGNRAFIAGADISELAKVTPIEAERQTRAGQAFLNLVEHLGKPVIAAVNGLAEASSHRRRPPKEHSRPPDGSPHGLHYRREK